MLSAPQYMQLLPSKVMSQFENGQILARGFVDGFKNGDHRSPWIGTSTEFAEHREYCPGDDPRNLDWRVYGKVDRYYVKQYVEETNLRATILLDTSASLSFTGNKATHGESNGVNKRLSKFAYARYLAATCAWLLTRQGDAVGLVGFDDSMRYQLPARSTATHLQTILSALHNTDPGGESSMSDVMHEIARRIPRRGLVIIISDFLDEVSDLAGALHHLRECRHEIIAFHVLADEELNFPFDDVARFRNLELPANQVDVNPSAIRQEYMRQLNAYRESLETVLGQVHAEYALFNTSQPYDELLANWLGQRIGTRGAS